MSAQINSARHERYELWSVSTLHLCALTFVAINALLAWVRAEPDFVIGAIYLLTFVHMAFCIARNNFCGARKATWILLVLALLVSEAARFSGYIIPVGQMSFSFGADGVFAPYIAKFLQNMALIGVNLSDLGALIFLFILGINISTYFTINKNGEGTLERLVVLGIILMFVVFLGSELFGGTQAVNASADPVIPPWYLLPFYSALRAIPDQTSGLILLFIMLAVPVLAIFIGKPKAKGRRLFLRILMVLALASFVGLGVLGAHSAENSTLVASQVLVAIYLSYFIIGTILTPRPEYFNG